MRTCQFLILCILLSLISVAHAETPAPVDVYVKLILADNKTVYRIGEQIKLVLEFTADREGYRAEFLPDGRTPDSQSAPAAIKRQKFKTHLQVRFATDSIYRDLMELYRTIGEKLPVDSCAGLLAYFAKHNEQEAIPLIEQALSELKPGEYPQLLTDLTALYYSEPMGAVVKKRLETDDGPQASHATYLIGLHGNARAALSAN